MSCRLVVVATILAAAAGCTVQPTPREYIDRQLPIDEVRLDVEVQVRERVATAVQALAAGDAETAGATLAPAPEILVIGPGAGQEFVGEAQVRAILDLFAARNDATVSLTDLEVDATFRATAVWFSARLQVHGAGQAEPLPVRMTGVYVQRESRWELRQAHFSVPVDVFMTSPPPAAEVSPAEAG